MLGFSSGSLKGAWVWRLDELPKEIISWGSTRTSLSEMMLMGAPSKELRNIHYDHSGTVFEHAVRNLRSAWTQDGDMSLVKIEPITRPEAYPSAHVTRSVPQYEVSETRSTRICRVQD